MKKLYIVLIAFLTFITLPGLHTQAFNYEYTNDVPIFELNNYTLDEIFIDNNIIGIDYNNIIKNATSWTVGNELTNTIRALKPNSILPNIRIPVTELNVFAKIGNTVYPNSTLSSGTTDAILVKLDVNNIVFRIDKTLLITKDSTGFELFLQQNNVKLVYETIDSNSNADVYINLYDEIQLDKIELGITSLTNEQIGEYYKNWLYNYTLFLNVDYQVGYNDGYNDGYIDAVQEDNAYALGYARGLSEGQDMETGSSIIVLVLAALSFGFMIFGFSSKKRIFNLFAAGLFIALGGLMVEFPAFIVISIGFVIFNIWYTFGSD
jgi:hypothetical protein